MSVTVSVDDKIIWSEALGYSDLKTKENTKISTKFRIGSTSKSLTSLAVGKLYQQGKLDLDTSIQVYVPYFPVKKYPLSIRMLSGHLAGIRDYNYAKGEYLSRKHYNSIQESVDIIKDDSLLFKPMTKYKYSTYGYNLIGAAIEKASGKPYLEYMKSEVFDLLGMKNTIPDTNEILITECSKFYDVRNDSLSEAVYVDNSNKFPGGGFLSTSLDLVKMGNALLFSDFLNKEITEMLFTSQKLSDGTLTGYGIGWRVGLDKAGEKIIHHAGSSIGGRAMILIYPEEHLVLAITSNLFFNNIEDSAMKIAQVFLK